MALALVVVNPFGGYLRGSMITDAATVNSIRASEYMHQVVLVSDEPIPDPEPPPPPPNFAELQAAWAAQQALIEAQQTALMAAVGVNQAQTDQLQSLATQLTQTNAALLALEAKVNAQPGTGTPLPPNLADDLPLAEADGVVISTDDGKILVGDIR